MENGHICGKLILLASTTLWLGSFALLPGNRVRDSDSAAPFLGQGLPLFCFFTVAAGVAFYCSLAVVFLGQHMPASVFSALLRTAVVSITSAFCLLFTFLADPTQSYIVKAFSLPLFLILAHPILHALSPSLCLRREATMSTGKLGRLILVVSLTAAMAVLSQIGDSIDLICSMAVLSVATAITTFSSLVLVLLDRQLPAFVAAQVVRASSIGLAAVLALLWCFLTGGRARLG